MRPDHLGIENASSIIPRMQEIKSQNCPHRQAEQAFDSILGIVLRLVDEASHLFGLAIPIRIFVIDSDNFSLIPPLLPGCAAELAGQMDKNSYLLSSVS